MKTKRMAMGAAVIGCVTAAMMSGAWAQGASGQLNARTGGNHMAATGQLNGTRRAETGFRAEGRTGAAEMREHHGFAARTQGRYVRGEHGAFVGAEGRYGRGWRGDRFPFRDRGVEVGVGAGVGVAVADDYGYRRGQPLYAYAPGYDIGYSVGPYYNYAPGYEVGYTARPYYDYAPGISVGIGPVGFGIGPAWGW